MSVILHSERITLRELTLSDDDFILALVNSEGWLRYIGDRSIHSVEAAREYLRQGPMQSYAVHGFGLWCVSRNSDDASLGICGWLKREDLHYPDLGFAFLHEFTGQGYAREAAKLSLEFARQHIRQMWGAAITTPENKRSIHLLESIGFRFERMQQFNDQQLRMYLVALSKQSYEI